MSFPPPPAATDVANTVDGEDCQGNEPPPPTNCDDCGPAVCEEFVSAGPEVVLDQNGNNVVAIGLNYAIPGGEEFTNANGSFSLLVYQGSYTDLAFEPGVTVTLYDGACSICIDTWGWQHNGDGFLVYFGPGSTVFDTARLIRELYGIADDDAGRALSEDMAQKGSDAFNSRPYGSSPIIWFDPTAEDSN